MMPLIRHIDIHYIFILHVPYENNNPNWHIFRSRCFLKFSPFNYRSLTLRSFPLAISRPSPLSHVQDFYNNNSIASRNDRFFLERVLETGRFNDQPIASRFDITFILHRHPAVKLLTLVTPLTTICHFSRALESLIETIHYNPKWQLKPCHFIYNPSILFVHRWIKWMHEKLDIGLQSRCVHTLSRRAIVKRFDSLVSLFFLNFPFLNTYTISKYFYNRESYHCFAHAFVKFVALIC